MTKKLSYFRNFETDRIPPLLYFDTSFVVSTLVLGDRYHAASFNFLKRLANKPPKEQPFIVFSEILRMELRCAIISICIRTRFGKNTNVLERIKANPDLVKEFYEKASTAEQYFSRLLQRFTNWAAIPLNEKINQRAGEIVGQYRLGSADAVHVATMEDWDINDVAAFDWGFDELPKYTVCYIWTCGQAKRERTVKTLRANEGSVSRISPEPNVVIEAEEIAKSGSKDDLSEPDTKVSTS